ncbi:MAG TPA: prepilin-type N-terminal cleavage/methylation domain-containing protein [Acidobacteriota bacterium]|nr:prepilin-type N-terminal cleavage/methylation domain-containing protein [Acidobacteriota bacterium]
MKSKKIKKNKQSGFTLLEVVVAFTILVLIASVMYAGLRVASDIYSKAQDRLEKKARQRVLLDYLKRQLGSLFPLRPSQNFLPQQGGEYDPENDPNVLSQAPLFHGTSRTLTFVTVAPFRHLRNPGLTVVTYGRAEDEWGSEYLGAMETRFMGVESFDYMADIPEGKPLSIIDDVEDVRFSYYGYDGQSEQYGWYDEWMGDLMGSVPTAVRIDYAENDYVVVPINATTFGNLNLLARQRALQRGLGLSRSPQARGQQ